MLLMSYNLDLGTLEGNEVEQSEFKSPLVGIVLLEVLQQSRGREKNQILTGRLMPGMSHSSVIAIRV